MTRPLRVLLALLLGLLVAAVGTSPAAAHAQLLESDPADGSVVAAAPEEITLTFNEPVRLESARLFAADGGEVEVDARSSDNLVVVDPSGDLGPGTVTVSWELVSEDGHVISGAIAFSIGEPTAGGPVGPAAERAEPGASATVVGVAGMLAALVALAGLVVRRAVLVRGGWAVAVVAGVLWLPLQTGGRLLDSAPWLDGALSWRGLLVLAALAGLALAIGPGREGRRVVAVLGAAVAVAAVAGVLVVDPAGPEPTGAVAATGPQQLEGELGDGTLRATVDRATGGSTTLTITATDADGAPVAPVEDPVVRLRGPDLDLGPVALTPTGPGAWTGAVAIPTAGEWALEVSVRLTDFDNPVVSLPFVVEG